jgi:hypothetical protein
MLLKSLYNQNFLAATSNDSSTPLPSPQLHQQHSAALFLPSQNPCKEGEARELAARSGGRNKTPQLCCFRREEDEEQCFLKEFYVCSQNGDRP